MLNEVKRSLEHIQKTIKTTKKAWKKKESNRNSRKEKYD